MHDGDRQVATSVPSCLVFDKLYVSMLDLNFVRDHLPLVEEKLRLRGMNPAEVLKDFETIDSERRQAITEAETLKAQRNRASEEIGKLKKSGQDPSALMAETKDLRDKIQELEKTATGYEARLRDLLAGIPNIPNATVPVGKSADDNVEVRRWGTPPRFDFVAKPHWELGEQLGVLDLERAAKLSGARFAVYWDLGARLERALANFMLDLHTREHGYTEMLPPYLGQLRLDVRDRAASEVRRRSVPRSAWRERSMADSHGGGPCHESLSRRNPGRGPSAGVAHCAIHHASAARPVRTAKMSRGIIRQHQFQKVELVKFPHPGNRMINWKKLTHDAGDVLAETGTALSRRDAVHGRHGLLIRQDVRHRSVATRTAACSAKFRRARISRRFRRGARTSATVRKDKGKRNSCTRSMEVASPWAAPGWRSSKTINRQMAAS